MDVLLITPAGRVDNCICADSVERALQFYPGHTCLERTPDLAHIGPGWLHDASTDTFTAPALAPEPDVHPEPLTRVDFMRRFSDAERIAIRTSAKGNPIVEDAMDLLSGADRVHLDDPGVVRFVHYIEALGLIAAGRASVVLGS